MCTIDCTHMYNTLYIRVWQGAPDDGAYTCIRRCRTGLRGKEKKGKERERKEGERRRKEKEGKRRGGERDFRFVPFPSLVPHYSKKCMNAMFPAEEMAFLTFPVAGL